MVRRLKKCLKIYRPYQYVFYFILHIIFYNIEHCIKFVYPLLILIDPEAVYLKFMVPQATAGSVIGKGGQNISDLQKEYNVHIRMSKANDVFPGKIHLHYNNSIKIIVFKLLPCVWKMPEKTRTKVFVHFQTQFYDPKT